MKALRLIFSVFTAAFVAVEASAFTYQSTIISERPAPQPDFQPIYQVEQSRLPKRGFFRGSIFQDTSACTRCKKGGSILNVGSCSRCSKDGSMFPGGPCKRCNKDGSFFPGGSCKNCDAHPCPKCKKEKAEKPCKNCPKVAPKAPFIVEYEEIAEHKCENLAPFMLGHVDFRLKNAFNSNPSKEKLGNYNFRIFGCRRFDKEAFLNEGRIMQKDMQFTAAFAEEVSGCYKIQQIPEDLCLETTPTPLPEYVLTAEIVDYFMNICDGYNWNDAKETNLRNGTSEMTVKWRLMNLAQTQVLWEGTTTGYGEVESGVENGEVLLVERAFADASSNLQVAEGFEQQLSERVPAEQIALQRQALIEQERLLNPAKCMYQEQIQKLQCPTCNCSVPVEVDDTYVEIPPEEVTVLPVCPIPTEVFVEPEAAIVEEGGVSDGEVFVGAEPEPVIVEDGGVTDGDMVVKSETVVEEVAPADVVAETAKEIDLDNLCIVDRPPYQSLTPENLYKVRASILSVTNSHGKRGSGLLVSDSFVLTSADLIDGKDNTYRLKTINGKALSGKAFRVNPTKNVALIMLDKPIEYTPLSLNLDLPEIGKGDFMVLGMLDVDDFDNGENYLDNNGVIDGYRYTDDKGAEIILDTYVQDVTIGGALIDQFGTINGIAHSSKKTEDGKDLFIPTETALRAVGLSICEKLYTTPSPWKTTIYKPVTKAIENAVSKAPEAMAGKERK